MIDALLNKFKSDWRATISVFLVIGFIFSILFFCQLYWVLLGCSFIFSLVVFAVESRKISEIIKGNIFIWLIISMVYITTIFLTKVYATHYFNVKYDIFVKYLNYSIVAYTGIVGTIVFISIICFFLSFRFLFQIWRQRKKFIKQAEPVIHLISCIMAIAFSSIVYLTVDNNETLLLYFDAYRYSDCQAPENQATIRKDDKTCYLMKYKGSLKWELENYPSNTL